VATRSPRFCFGSLSNPRNPTKARPTSRRVDANRTAIGRSAEEIAAARLGEEGFRILWRNARIGPLEVDLVAKKDDLVLIVEVRSRGPNAFEGPLASITWNKRRMLLRAARGLWRGRLKKMADVQRVRIDVIAITTAKDGTTSVEWIRGAITEDMR
jgi:putative endonuclease